MTSKSPFEINWPFLNGILIEIFYESCKNSIALKTKNVDAWYCNVYFIKNAWRILIGKADGLFYFFLIHFMVNSSFFCSISSWNVGQSDEGFFKLNRSSSRYWPKKKWKIWMTIARSPGFSPTVNDRTPEKLKNQNFPICLLINQYIQLGWT